ncbi:hypothetical protein WG906_03090 [Pedobacter sp. P351]|uniref:hypothetical protein n=1 Tax=Pedobacter superstes TaxID=3133441 RepID=UPI0030B29AC8
MIPLGTVKTGGACLRDVYTLPLQNVLLQLRDDIFFGGKHNSVPKRGDKTNAKNIGVFILLKKLLEIISHFN